MTAPDPEPHQGEKRGQVSQRSVLNTGHRYYSLRADRYYSLRSSSKSAYEVEIDSALDGRYAGKNQPIVQGSYAFVSPHVYLEQLDGLRIELCVFPTRQDGTRTLVSSWGDEGGFAIELCDGVPCFRVGVSATGVAELGAEHKITLRRWTRITASFDSEGGRLRLGLDPLVDAPGDHVTARAWTGTANGKAQVASNGPLIFAAQQCGDTPDQHFDGIDGCRIDAERHHPAIEQETRCFDAVGGEMQVRVVAQVARCIGPTKSPSGS